MADKYEFEDYDVIDGDIDKGGAFGQVFKVRHKKLDYVRALKVLSEFILNEEVKKYKNFLNECKILLRLGNGANPYIVHITQPQLLNHHAIVEMEYIEGEDLQKYIAKKCSGFVPISEVLNFLRNICCALAYCHFDIYKFCINKDEDKCVLDDDDGNPFISSECEKILVDKYKVIHNDLHSKNIMRKYDGSYILLDFGLAFRGDDIIKSSLRKGGCDEYKATEKWDDDGIITEQSDIYSFGVLMYEMLTGNVPFALRKKDSQVALGELKNKHLTETPPSIENARKRAFEKINNQTWAKDYPDWLEDIVLKCLEKKPENRFTNAKELNDFLIKKLGEEKQFNLKILQYENTIEHLVNEKASYEEIISKKSITIGEMEVQNGSELQRLKDISTGIPIITNSKHIKGTKIFRELLIVLMCLSLTFTGYVLGLKLQSNHEITEVKNKEMNVKDQKYFYTGQVSNYIPNGFGTAIYNDSLVYTGMFNNGQRDGIGKLTNNYGSYYGDFTQNYLRGCYMFLNKDGRYSIGEYSNGNPNGIITYFDKKGSIIMQKSYINGKLIDKIYVFTYSGSDIPKGNYTISIKNN